MTTVINPVGRRTLTAAACVFGAIYVASLSVSAKDLYDWAAGRGLALPEPFPWAVPLGLDVAAAACIGMKVVKAWRMERGGVWTALIWTPALVSAFAQFSHGRVLLAQGVARDRWWAGPMFALFGPIVLEALLTQVRKWVRNDSGAMRKGASGFGWAWLPGIALRETWAAWRTSRREGIEDPSDAITFVRELRALRGMSELEALRFALAELRTTDTHGARKWLLRHGVVVAQSAVDEVAQVRDGLPAQGGSGLRSGLAADAAQPAPRKVAQARPRKVRGDRDEVRARELLRTVPMPPLREIERQTGVRESTLRNWRAKEAAQSAQPVNGHDVLAGGA